MVVYKLVFEGLWVGSVRLFPSVDWGWFIFWFISVFKHNMYITCSMDTVLIAEKGGETGMMTSSGQRKGVNTGVARGE